MATRVLVADDHPIVRNGLAALLESRADAELVGVAEDGQTAIDLAVALQPDVVVMDLHMPGLSGAEATRQLREAAPSIAVLVLTMFDDDDSLFDAVRAGARGYVLKGADQAEIMRAILEVAAGGVMFGPSVAQRVLATVAGKPDDSRPSPHLTDREHDVLRLLADGLGNHAIAARLGLSDKTVRNYVSMVLVKLGVDDRASAMITAREAGLGRRRDPASELDRRSPH